MPIVGGRAAGDCQQSDDRAADQCAIIAISAVETIAHIAAVERRALLEFSSAGGPHEPRQHRRLKPRSAESLLAVPSDSELLCDRVRRTAGGVCTTLSVDTQAVSRRRSTFHLTKGARCTQHQLCTFQTRGGTARAFAELWPTLFVIVDAAAPNQSGPSGLLVLVLRRVGEVSVGTVP